MIKFGHLNTFWNFDFFDHSTIYHPLWAITMITVIRSLEAFWQPIILNFWPSVPVLRAYKHSNETAWPQSMWFMSSYEAFIWFRMRPKCNTSLFDTKTHFRDKHRFWYQNGPFSSKMEQKYNQNTVKNTWFVAWKCVFPIDNDQIWSFKHFLKLRLFRPFSTIYHHYGPSSVHVRRFGSQLFWISDHLQLFFKLKNVFSPLLDQK